MFTRDQFPQTYSSLNPTMAQRAWLNQDLGKPRHRLLRFAFWLLGYGTITFIKPTITLNPGWTIGSEHPVQE